MTGMGERRYTTHRVLSFRDNFDEGPLRMTSFARHCPACPIALIAALLALAARPATAQLASFTDVSTPVMNDNLWGEGVAWGDYDGDGDLVLFIANSARNRLHLNNDDGTSPVPETPVEG